MSESEATQQQASVSMSMALITTTEHGDVIAADNHRDRVNDQGLYIIGPYLH